MRCLPPAFPPTLKPRRATLLLLAALAGSASADEALLAELETLRAELERLRTRVSELEARLVGGDDAVTNGATSAAPVPAATPTAAAVATPRGPSVSAGGRIKLDVVYNRTSSGRGDSNDTALSPGAIPLDGSGERDQVHFTARGSRVWLKGWNPTPLGDAGAYLELDLYGGGGNERVTNSYNVRLRHGYAELAGVLFGQTYSTFMNVSAYPELNDDGIVVGAALTRQPMLRYTTALAGGSLSLALESPESTLAVAADPRFAPDDDRLPDLVARYGRAGVWGNWSLAVLARELRVDDAAGSGADDSAAGFGVNAAGLAVLGADDSLRASLTAGNAVGRYLSGNAFAAGRIGADGDIDTTWSAGGYVSWQHWFTPAWRSNLTAGYAWQADDGAWDIENQAVYSGHANLMWNPVVSTTLGLELIFGARERFDGRDGEVLRLQFSAVHKF